MMVFMGQDYKDFGSIIFSEVEPFGSCGCRSIQTAICITTQLLANRESCSKDLL